MTFPFPLIGSGTGFSATYLGNASDNTSQASYSFASQSFGVADADRRIVVVAYGLSGSAQTISSMTIGGVSATIHVTAYTAPFAGSGVTSIGSAAVPTGTTGTVAVIFDGAMARSAIVIYRVVGGNFTSVYATASDTKFAADPSTTINVPQDGALIAGASTINPASTTTWTGVTETVDTAVSSMVYTSGIYTPTTVQASRTVTADFSAPGDVTTLACLSIARR